MEQQDLNIFEAGLSQTAKAYLLETSRWTKFLAILGFVGTGLMILGFILVITMGSALGGLTGVNSAGAGGLFGALIVFALYFYPIFALYKFSVCIKQGINADNAELVTEAFRYQKNMFKFMGIFTIVLLAFYLLIFIFAGIAGLGAL